MESVGEFFKQVRETKGLTLEDVASKTRINPDFLIALEEGNFAKLPDQVFAKGFVRSYARSLGVDEVEAVRRFEGSAGAFYEKQAEREQLRLKQAEDERRKKANRKVVIAATGVAFLGLVLLVTREQSAVPPSHTQTPEPISSQEGESPEYDKGGAASASPEAQQLSTPRSSEPSLPAPSVPSPPSSQASRDETIPLLSEQNDPLGGLPRSGATGDAPLVLDLEALELTWVVVQVDNQTPQEALLRPGEKVRWKGSDRFTLTLGNAGGVRVELNGKVQGPFGPSGKVARDIVLNRSSL